MHVRFQWLPKLFNFVNKADMDVIVAFYICVILWFAGKRHKKVYNRVINCCFPVYKLPLERRKNFEYNHGYEIPYVLFQRIH